MGDNSTDMVEDIKIKDLNRYRMVWMGGAMIWIVFYHLALDFSVLSFIKHIGYGGVDIFMFASGLGNYYSYLKDHSPLGFLKRRIFRLAPVYLPFISVWIIVEFLHGEIKFPQIVGNLFGIQGFSAIGGEFNWYLTGIIICYLLTPYFTSFIESNKLIKSIILVIFLLLISVVFWEDGRMIISIIRLPIYTLGMIFAKYDEKILTRKFIWCEAICFVLGGICLYLAFGYANNYLWNYGLYWYPFILMTPFMCHLISLVSIIFTKIKIGKGIVNLLSMVGSYSFEIYLVHIFLFGYLEQWLSQNTVAHKSIIRIFALVPLILLVMLLRFVSNILKRLLQKCDNVGGAN